MPPINRVTGTSGEDSLAGTPGADLVYGYNPSTAETTAPGFSPLAAGLGAALFATAAPGDAGRLFVLDKIGLIRVVELGTGRVAGTPFLDLRAEVDPSGEQGLLGLAFHPDFQRNGRFYVYLSNLAGDSEVREYRVDPADPGRVPAGGGRLLLRVDQPDGVHNHKAGWIGFGPDGQLHVALGDGGPGGDPSGTGQDPTDLLGSILRIDVERDDFPADQDRNYGIPAGNPFAGGAQGAPEVWAYGLRNPFRDAFDRGTGDLLIGDVGQGAWEEIDLGAAGANYGWRLYEGPAPYPPGGTPAPREGLTFPIHAYSHASGDGASVIGGYVYRGPETGLQGRYVFGDFVSGKVWALEDGDGDGVWRRGVISDGGLFGARALSSFGEDAEGNLYAVTVSGRLYRLEAGAPAGGGIDRGDTLLGGGGADRIFAGAGADLANGGGGADLLSGMEGADTLAGIGGADSLIGGAEGDLLAGGEGDDALLGGPGDDRLRGRAGDDLLLGGEGRDRLLGEAGADTFRWASAAEGGDVVPGFAPAEGDRIEVSAAGFGGALVAGPLAAGRFARNASGQATSPAGTGQFVYEDDVGRLWWDADGAGGTARQLVATLSGVPALAAADIVVIA